MELAIIPACGRLGNALCPVEGLASHQQDRNTAHTLADVVGFRKLREFLRRELIPRFRAKGDKALSGAAVAGPFHIEQARLDRMITRVIAAARPVPPVVH